MADTSSRGRIAEEPLGFILFTPAVLGQMKILIFLIYLNSKIVHSIYRNATALFCL